MLFGWETLILYSSAQALTGENTIFPLLPRLSGCVTTNNTSCPAFIMLFNAGTAKSGVPIYTIRI